MNTKIFLSSAPSALTLGFLCHCFLASGARAQTDSIEIVFDKEPIERGLSFDRRGVRPATVKFGDKEFQSWMSDGSIEPSQGWLRSFRFKVTDPKFQNAGRPSVDIEITYHQPANAGWSLKADTKDGGKQIGNGWGNTTGWRTSKIRLDNAFFGARDPKSGQPASVDGFDLRFDGTNDRVYLRSIKITGSDPKTNVDWGRMLKTGAVETDMRGGIFAFNRAPKHEIRANVQNLALVARPLHYRFEVSGYDGKNRHSAEGQFNLKPDSSEKLPLAFSTAGWPLGPYDAKLSLFLQKGDAKPIYTRTLRMGIVSDTILPKAREGEFLFGLDAANSYVYDTQQENGFAFYRLMGVDILRDVHRRYEETNVQSVGKALELLKREELQGMLMFDPPNDADAGARNRALPGVVRRLEEISRAHVGRGLGKLRYFELGNEPDLTFFYPGSMSDYAAAFSEMRGAIKRVGAEKGLKPEDTVVLNGGLSFAGPDGERRSREFLKIIAREDLDAIAYHGHGKGGESERENLERARDAAIKGGKEGVPFVETESGFSGNDQNGLMEQARTAVEKMVYAQSQGMETFMFFRLFMEGSGSEGGYGLTDNLSEPRPSVMSYRHMVERLRHHRFVKNVDFAKALDAPGLNAHLFEERDAAGKVTGRKTLVAWSEKPAQFDLALRLDSRGATVSKAQNFDLFGNPTATKVLAGNVASVPVGSEPVFVTWQSSGTSALVDVAPSLLTIRADEALISGATTQIAVLARNPEAKDQSAKIEVKAFSRVPISAQVAPANVTLRGDGEPVSSQIAVKLAATDAPLALPTWWKVFTDVDATKITPELLKSVPQNVAGARGEVAGQYLLSRDFPGGQRLELAKLAGGFGEKRAALAFATLDAPRDIILPIAASADWWMQWSVNGQTVYSTLDRGNEHGGLADHTFNLPLKKGKNVISALTLSGSGGWKLEFGGPKERELALTAGTDPDRLEVSLVANGKTLSTQVVPLQINAPIAKIESVPTNLAGWMELQPLAQLDGEAVTNFFVKEPDQSRWYKGEDDLSALVWLRESGANLQIALAVRDENSVEAPTVAGLKDADSARVFLRDEGGKTLADVSAGMVRGVATTGGTAGVSTQITREYGRLLYILTMPKSLVGSVPFRLSLAVNDNDSNFLKQKATLGEGAGLRLLLP